jgi:hypothetical protein
MMRPLGDGKHVIFRQRVRGSVRAFRAVRNTWVFQTETGVVAEGCYASLFNLKQIIHSSELPMSFRYHLSQDVPLLFVILVLLTSTPANHGSSNTTVWSKVIGIELNDGLFNQSAPC